MFEFPGCDVISKEYTEIRETNGFYEKCEWNFINEFYVTVIGKTLGK